MEQYGAISNLRGSTYVDRRIANQPVNAREGIRWFPVLQL
jgi:hypothetical protein